MPNKRRKRRKYQIRDEAFVRYVVSSIKKLPKHRIGEHLDDYERYATVRPAQWVREAPMEEILAVCAKIGVTLYLVGHDAEKPMKAAELMRGAKEFFKTKDANAMMEWMAKHKFFCMSGAAILKNLGAYSQLVNGDMYVPNKDYAAFLTIGFHKGKLTKELQAAVDEILGRSYILGGTEYLSTDDLAVLYLIRMNDSLPMGSIAIHSMLTHNRHPKKVSRSLAKLVVGKYICQYGTRANAMYGLLEKGWLVLNERREELFRRAKISSFEVRHEVAKLLQEQYAADNTREKQPERKKAVA